MSAAEHAPAAAGQRRIALAAARATLSRLDAVDVEPGTEAGLSDVRQVVAVVASSRGGSSLVHRLLGDHPDALSIGGEHTVVYKLNGLERGPDGSDVIDVDAQFDQTRLSADFMALVSASSQGAEWRSAEYAATITRRLALQWPAEGIDYSTVLPAVESVRALKPQADPGTVFAAVLDDLATACPGLDSRYYDLPGSRPGLGTERCEPPAGGLFVEEPPFVVPAPRRAPTAADVDRRPLVIKSSVDAYRLPLLRRLFPAAEIRLVHLTRNPAASVNGLYDGWRDRGFFSYDVSGEAVLSMPGYAELGPRAASWWNFDVPPDWTEHVASPLEYACAAQWRGAHTAILETIGSAGADRILRLSVEEILQGATRGAALRRLFDFAGLDARHAVTDLPVVMATAPPGRARWRTRAETILPALDDEATRAVARELGYSWERTDTWI